jgi:hypothetical protein
MKKNILYLVEHSIPLKFQHLSANHHVFYLIITVPSWITMVDCTLSHFWIREVEFRSISWLFTSWLLIEIGWSKTSSSSQYYTTKSLDCGSTNWPSEIIMTFKLTLNQWCSFACFFKMEFNGKSLWERQYWINSLKNFLKKIEIIEIIC